MQQKEKLPIASIDVINQRYFELGNPKCDNPAGGITSTMMKRDMLLVYSFYECDDKIGFFNEIQQRDFLPVSSPSFRARYICCRRSFLVFSQARILLAAARLVQRGTCVQRYRADLARRGELPLTCRNAGSAPGGHPRD